MVERLSDEAVELGETGGGVPRVGEQCAAFAEHLRVQPRQRVTQSDVELGVGEVAVRGAAQLVGRAVLVNQPRDLIRVPREVRRKFCPDDEIDRAAVTFAEIQEAPRRGVRKNLFLRVPLEWHADELGRVAASAQLAYQLTDVNLRAAVHEGNLRLANEDRLDGHRSGRVTEVDDIAVLHDVVLPFEPQLAVLATRGKGT